MVKQVSQSPALMAATLCLAFLSATPRILAQDAVASAESGTPTVTTPPPADKYLWLEDTNSPLPPTNISGSKTPTAPAPWTG